MRVVFLGALCIVLVGSSWAESRSSSKPAAKAAKGAATVPSAGVKTPGVQIPMASLKYEAEFPVQTPESFSFTDDVLVMDSTKNAIMRIDPKTGKVAEPLSGFSKPCSGAISAFRSLWVPNCGTGTVSRVDLKTGKITATLDIGAADVLLGLAATGDSVWMMTDNKTTLSRIDPVANMVVAELRLPAGCTSLVLGEGALWVACPSEDKVLRVNPQTNLVDKYIEVSAEPRVLAVGSGSIWALCAKEGEVDRIDPKTNKVAKTIELDVAGAGDLAFGEGSLWVTQPGFPITRIDPESEKVVQQFRGEGGGVIAAGAKAIWLGNVKQGSVWRLDPRRIAATLAE
jgi:virginiamycin B lyase